METAPHRTFHWDDLPALVELMDRVRRADGDERVVDQVSLREFLAQPGLRPEENCSLFQSAAGLQAYTLMHLEPPIKRAVLETGIHPDHQGSDLLEAVLRSALDRARSMGARVLHLCLPRQAKLWKGVLQQEGFRPVRTYWLMRRDGSDPPLVEAPQGFSIRTFRPGEGKILAEMQNSAFAESWGFSPNSPEEVEYRATMSLTGAGGILFLIHGEDLAGYCWTTTEKIHTGASIGTIGMIGIQPSYRGQGLSKPILAAGMQYLHSRGVGYVKLDVDAENNPAIRLYTAVGFQKTAELQWFEVPLSDV